MPDARSCRLRLLAVVAVAIAVAWGLGAALWFLCDDAFILYRYVGNLHDGHGLVWNPAPFAPVEGYTSFGFVIVLWAVWALTGVEPPVAATPITFLAGAWILWAVGRRVRTLFAAALPGAAADVATALALLAIACNPSFATWLGSGLETMLFALCAVLWTLRATAPGGARGTGLAWLGLAAAGAELVRPDGMLLVLATLAIGARGLLGPERRGRVALAALLPAAVPAAHFAWRRAYYGEWLPNTYYCKVAAAWPASGGRYLFCFVLENGLWLWGLVVALALVAAAARRGSVRALAGERFPALVAAGTWLAFVAYYTLVVGGDHFAWRVFVHLVPLCALALVAACGALRLRTGPALAVLVAYGVASCAPGWWIEHLLVGKEREGFVRLAARGPSWLGPVLRPYDCAAAWLHLHSVAFRRPVHDAMCRIARNALPERRPGLVAGAAPGQRLVYRADAVGVVSWALADVAIVDGHGLNDWVIARWPVRQAPATDAASVRAAFPALDRDGDGRLGTPELEASSALLASIGPALQPATWAELMISLGDQDGDDALDAGELAAAVAAITPPRHMAHEREPPPGYVEALHCNVIAAGGRHRVDPAVVPLTDAEVREVEARFRDVVRAAAKEPK
ncbi:MAG: hypothetical protein U1E73_07195 [Planctomycetota bacterium]